MVDLLYRKDPYLSSAPARVVTVNDRGGITLDAPLFYPTGGGQAGDAGEISWGDQRLPIATTVASDEGPVLVPQDTATLPAEGTEVTQTLDWERRLRCMRLHTCLHLLSVVVPLPVTGGQITHEKGRLDFDMPDAPEDRQAIEDQLNALILEDHPVTEQWITDAELDANPGLVKTISVAPPRGQGRIRLVRIGDGPFPVDLQPCGGTHVRRTSEIGPVRLGKIEKKGKRNRRISVLLA